MPTRISIAFLLYTAWACTPTESPPSREASSTSTALSPNAESRPPWTTSRVRGTPEPPPPYRLEEAFGGVSFYNPVFVVPLPAGSRFLIGELCGRIYSIDRDAPDDEPVLAIDLWKDLPDRPPPPGRGRPAVKTDNPLPGEQIYDLAFDPDFQTNRQVFITYFDPDSEFLVRLSRFEMSSLDPPQVLRDSETRFLSWRGEGHNGGCVRFGPDGYLYVSTGDGVMPNPPDSKNVGQDLGNLLSSVLRIDVHGQESDKPYAIPSDNPFREHETARPEVWAYGFRNPWKMDFNMVTGDLWLGDIGWESWEMVHHVVAGGNYGWPVMEGRMPLRSDVTPGPTPIVPPVKDHPRTEAHSITGGVVYAGDRHEELRGWFVYGDFHTGRVWALDTRSADDLRHRELTESAVRIVDFAQDSVGDIYALDHDFTGKIYKLVRSQVSTDAEEFPTRLSETGLFASVQDLKPARGVVPYEVVVRPWMDGAHAERLLALPGESRVETVRVDGKLTWKFPEGSVLAKTLFYPGNDGGDPIRLETQILHHEGATWRAYGYEWNEAQDDAVLVSREGSEREVGGSSWRTVSRVECLTCHRPGEGYVLGFVPSQLDLAVDHGAVRKNQVELLADMSVLPRWPVPSDGERVKLVDPHDTRADLDARARSYLHVNCGICHNRHGGSIVFFYLKKGPSLLELKALVAPMVGSFGLSDPRIIAPGEPYRSALLYRVGKLGSARMPYVGSQVVDPAGFSLLHDWIASLDPNVKAPPQTDVASLGVLTRDGVSVEEQTQGVDHLLSSTSGALALVALMHGGELPADLQARIVDRSQESPSADIRSVFENFVPPSQRRKRLGLNIRPEDILAIEGQAARGKLIYTSDSSRCRTCHIPNSEGQRPLGPELKRIASKKYPPAEMLRQILEPSLKMDPEYTPYLLVTVSGEVHVGLLIEKTDAEVVIRDARQELIRVPADQVASFEKQTTSIMPDKLLSDLTAQEAADLLAFLVALQSDGEPGTRR